MAEKREAQRAKIIEIVKEEQKKLGNELKERTVGYILGALGVVAGIAWNDTIRAVIDYLFPLDKSGILAKFIYAVIMTVILVIISVYLIRLTQKKEG